VHLLYFTMFFLFVVLIDTHLIIPNIFNIKILAYFLYESFKCDKFDFAWNPFSSSWFFSHCLAWKYNLVFASINTVAFSGCFI
ncbi:hypothetical protein BDC45DRAFT_516576, partial [Circinella umbellata]